MGKLRGSKVRWWFHQMGADQHFSGFPKLSDDCHFSSRGGRQLRAARVFDDVWRGWPFPVLLTLD